MAGDSETSSSSRQNRGGSYSSGGGRSDSSNQSRGRSYSRSSSRQNDRFQRRRRRQPPIKIKDIDWKNLRALRYFLESDGSIRPRRKTGASAKYQRQVALAVKRARYMALLPYTHGHLQEMHQELERDLPDLRRSK
ncbi:MAG: 30S ribosomal protein S18 [Anaerolineae bacterium]|nr:30S ribosomal protein S18 [Anaerolineae bacterium]